VTLVLSCQRSVDRVPETDPGAHRNDGVAASIVAGRTRAAPGVEELSAGATPEDTTVLAPVVSVNDVMFAVGATNGSPWGSGILRSPSPGDRWDWVELPEGPKPSTTEPTYWHVQPHDEQVVVSAARAALSEVSLCGRGPRWMAL